MRQYQKGNSTLEQKKVTGYFLKTACHLIVSDNCPINFLDNYVLYVMFRILHHRLRLPLIWYRRVFTRHQAAKKQFASWCLFMAHTIYLNQTDILKKMDIEAIKYISYENEVPPVKTVLRNGSNNEFKASIKDKNTPPPVVYVVSSCKLSHFKSRKGVIDCDIQQKTVELSRILLGRKNVIPILETKYAVAARLVSSVRNFISQAKDDNNYYILGADDNVFEDIWRSLDEPSVCKRQDAVPEYSQSTEDKRKVRNDSIPCSLMDLMKIVPVPKELEETFIGSSLEAMYIRQMILCAAKNSHHVLILGESGTGKEVVAREIYRNSNRHSEKFVAVNCGGLPDTLLELELFGYKKGSFTGATKDKKGLWEEAGSGTLFLDEIGELSLNQQVKILRALQEGEIRPLGGLEDVNVKARIIAATNNNLFSMVQAGLFREDLYYRLRGFLIHTFALRDHPEDIPAIVESIWKSMINEQNKRLSSEVIEQLKKYNCPGNVRDLKTVLSNMYSLFFSENVLGLKHLKATFNHLGFSTIPEKETHSLSQKTDSVRSADCLRHLRRVLEVVNATERLTKAIVNRTYTDIKNVSLDSSQLRLRLDELDMLCIHPLLFHSQSTFDSINILKSKLLYFQRLLSDDARAARKHWKENTADEFNIALSSVINEAEELMKIECQE